MEARLLWSLNTAPSSVRFRGLSLQHLLPDFSATQRPSSHLPHPQPYNLHLLPPHLLQTDMHLPDIPLTPAVGGGPGSCATIQDSPHHTGALLHGLEPRPQHFLAPAFRDGAFILTQERNSLARVRDGAVAPCGPPVKCVGTCEWHWLLGAKPSPKGVPRSPGACP